MRNIILIVSFLTVLVGCGGGQSALDKCTDSKKHLWKKGVTGNEYKGNEPYWDAMKACENKHT